MDESQQKWIMFLKGASPTLLLLLLLFRHDAGVIMFFGAIVYCVVGLVIYGYLRDKDAYSKPLARAFVAGVFSGVMATFFLSVTFCFSRPL